MRPRPLRGQQLQVEESGRVSSWSSPGASGSSLLCVPSHILGGHGRLCCIFRIFGSRAAQLLPHNPQAARQLLAVCAVVADQEGLLPVLCDESGDIHGGRWLLCGPWRGIERPEHLQTLGRFGRIAPCSKKFPTVRQRHCLRVSIQPPPAAPSLRYIAFRGRAVSLALSCPSPPRPLPIQFHQEACEAASLSKSLPSQAFFRHRPRPRTPPLHVAPIPTISSGIICCAPDAAGDARAGFDMPRIRRTTAAQSSQAMPALSTHAAFRLLASRYERASSARLVGLFTSPRT